MDTSDATLWTILKATAGGGTYLLHVGRDGALIGAPDAAANGIAYDATSDRLVILYDGIPATVRWLTKVGTDLSASSQVIGLPSDTADHLCFDPGTGELLVSWGANGAPGAIGRYNRTSYEGQVLVAVDTPAGTDAIEGIALFNRACHVVNDAATHPGSPPVNRVLRYSL